MRDVVKFYAAKLTRDAERQVHMASSNAHETYWNVPSAITDLAAVKSLFPVTIAASQSLGLDADLRTQWQNVLTNLAPYPTSNNAYLPHDAADRPDPQRRERRLGGDLALQHDRDRRPGLPDRAQHLEHPAVPLRQRLGQRRDPGGPPRPRRPDVQRHEDDAAEIPELPERADRQHQRRVRVPRREPLGDERGTDAELQRQNPRLPRRTHRLLLRRQIHPRSPRTASRSAPNAKPAKSNTSASRACTATPPPW